jgi:hypothetical protein
MAPRRDQLKTAESMKSTVPPIGQVFGQLTVIGLGKRKYYWLCKCECGNTTETTAHRILTGSTKSCGCFRKKTKQDLTGKCFGRLTVLGHVKEEQTRCICKCDCGSPVKTVAARLLLLGESTSCGCYRLEMATKANTKHGKSSSRAYRIWLAMMGRCNNTNSTAYSNYGGRGIKVCKKWESFENFYADMSEPSTDATIERIDNDGEYSKTNCRWATRAEQVRNRRNNVWIEFNGKNQLLADWARETGMPAVTLRYRIKAGWSIEKALTTPGQSKKKEA